MNHDNTLNLAITPLFLGLKFSSRSPESSEILFIFLDSPEPSTRLKISSFKIFDFIDYRLENPLSLKQFLIIGVIL